MTKRRREEEGETSIDEIAADGVVESDEDEDEDVEGQETKYNLEGNLTNFSPKL